MPQFLKLQALRELQPAFQVKKHQSTKVSSMQSSTFQNYVHKYSRSPRKPTNNFEGINSGIVPNLRYGSAAAFEVTFSQRSKEVTNDQSSNGLGIDGAAAGFLAVNDESNGLGFAYGGAAAFEANQYSNGVSNDQFSFGELAETDTLTLSEVDNVDLAGVLDYPHWNLKATKSAYT